MSAAENAEAQVRSRPEAQLMLLRLENEFYRSCLAVRQSAVELREMQTYILRELWETEVERRKKLGVEAARAITELKRSQEVQANATVREDTLSSHPIPAPCPEQPQSSGLANQLGSPRPANQLGSPRPANQLGSLRLDPKDLKGGLSLCIDRCVVAPSKQTRTGLRGKRRKRRVRVNMKKKRETDTKPEEGRLKLTEVSANEVAAVPWVNSDQQPTVEVTIVGDCLEEDRERPGGTSLQDQQSLLLPEARNQREIASPTWSDGELTLPLRRGKRKQTVVVFSSSSSSSCSPPPESLSSKNRLQRREEKLTVASGAMSTPSLPLPSKNETRRRKACSPMKRQSSTSDSTVEHGTRSLMGSGRRTRGGREALAPKRQGPSLLESEEESFPTSDIGSVGWQLEKGGSFGPEDETVRGAFTLSSDLEDPHRELSPEIPLQGNISSARFRLTQRQGKNKAKKPSKGEGLSRPSPQRTSNRKSMRPGKRSKASSVSVSPRGSPKRPWDLRSDDAQCSSVTSEVSLTEGSVTFAGTDTTLPATKKRKTLMSYKKAQESTLTVVEEDLPKRRTTLVVNTRGLLGPKLKPKT